MTKLHPFTPANARRLWIALFVALAAVLVCGVFFHAHGPDALSESLGFNAWYGFLASAGLVGLSKLLGLILKRGDRYYDD